MVSWLNYTTLSPSVPTNFTTPVELYLYKIAYYLNGDREICPPKADPPLAETPFAESGICPPKADPPPAETHLCRGGDLNSYALRRPAFGGMRIPTFVGRSHFTI
ncbi:MAG: hypothetical protein A2Y67_03355 [Candidatus Buchananbacteria bacterium RBG_13_39_9]|uniref:Uncharacterized protein n=1 Tax=Candidatus Buchananbacteria bacterium RBG_13_39_9 TaxID=1797531 RepID=A0A1G1XSJ8_9BACT|nr:MAG: hypothetical protein A2Y67_03355 [Candidatus Buchananbacteria bacterium RBG_13_39_9]